jgi:periplasmic protein TonB
MRRLATLAVVLLMGIGRLSAQQNEATTGGRLFVPGSVMAKYCTSMVSPHYPTAPTGTTKSALVVLRVAIRKTGTVVPISAVSGPHELESSAMDAVRLWRYKPYTKDGEPVDVVTEIPVEFYPGRPGGMVSHPSK